MKTLTCAQMGGPCEAEVKGATPEEMLAAGMTHLEEAHPEMVDAVKNMPKDDPSMVKWNEDFQKSFADSPEHA